MIAISCLDMSRASCSVSTLRQFSCILRIVSFRFINVWFLSSSRLIGAAGWLFKSTGDLLKEELLLTGSRISLRDLELESRMFLEIKLVFGKCAEQNGFFCHLWSTFPFTLIIFYVSTGCLYFINFLIRLKFWTDFSSFLAISYINFCIPIILLCFSSAYCYTASKAYCSTETFMPSSSTFSISLSIRYFINISRFCR